ncbi:hypothetical protein COU76_00930 [Candidatus Peregrinibacteria bacterium CG10_big_fil_rev_8_21_14_0_10_49_10]|nr:MAG: hypothetical protein COU76_00930 [Candidatus Peregrinibacteria bacterium CG10_big_fil_rev_8_21_14_0_10_49_10]
MSKPNPTVVETTLSAEDVTSIVLAVLKSPSAINAIGKESAEGMNNLLRQIGEESTAINTKPPSAPPSAKLLSIKEASGLTGVPAYTLRYWEKEFEEFLQPPRTGGGIRRYDRLSLEMIKEITHLVDEERYSLAGARGVLQSMRSQKETLQSLQKKIEESEEIRQIVEQFIQSIREPLLKMIVGSV